jgi:hypothetical protein
MKKHKIALLLLVSFGFTKVSYSQTVFEEDIQDYDNATGIGCFEKEPITNGANFYIVCKSGRSEEAAWNAVLYKGKIACGVNKLSLFFNVSPTLPENNGIHGAQAEIQCGHKP